MSFVISNGVHDFVSLIKLLLLTPDLPRGFFPFLPLLGAGPRWAGKSPAWGWAQGSRVSGAASSAGPCPSAGLWGLSASQAFVGSGSEGKESLASPATAARLSRLLGAIFSIISKVPPGRL